MVGLEPHLDGADLIPLGGTRELQDPLCNTVGSGGRRGRQSGRRDQHQSEQTCHAMRVIVHLPSVTHAAREAAPIRPARTSRPGIAPVCSPRSKIGAPATSVAS